MEALQGAARIQPTLSSTWPGLDLSSGFFAPLFLEGFFVDTRENYYNENTKLVEKGERQ